MCLATISRSARSPFWRERLPPRGLACGLRGDSCRTLSVSPQKEPSVVSGPTSPLSARTFSRTRTGFEGVPARTLRRQLERGGFQIFSAPFKDGRARDRGFLRTVLIRVVLALCHARVEGGHTTTFEFADLSG